MKVFAKIKPILINSIFWLGMLIGFILGTLHNWYKL
nr:MAG TPA: YtxH-like protein [Caudoviricetes sp.]